MPAVATSADIIATITKALAIGVSRFNSYSIGDLYESSRPGEPVFEISQWTEDVQREYPDSDYTKDELTGAWTLKDDKIIFDSPKEDGLKLVWTGAFNVKGDKLMGGVVSRFRPRVPEINFVDDFITLFSASNPAKSSRSPLIRDHDRRQPSWEDRMIMRDLRWLSPSTETTQDQISLDSASGFFLAPMRNPLHTVLLF